MKLPSWEQICVNLKIQSPLKFKLYSCKTPMNYIIFLNEGKMNGSWQFKTIKKMKYVSKTQFKISPRIYKEKKVQKYHSSQHLSFMLRTNRYLAKKIPLKEWLVPTSIRSNRLPSLNLQNFCYLKIWSGIPWLLTRWTSDKTFPKFDIWYFIDKL